MSNVIKPSEKAALFHTLTVDEALNHLNSNYNGLDKSEAENRLSMYGKNELRGEKNTTLLEKFINQFKNVMIVILLVASVVSGFMGEITDAVIIISIVLINAILGVIQENKAEKALAALKKMASPYSKVKRNGSISYIKSDEIVLGDIVALEAGDLVPADMRLIESANMKIEEAALTGESVPAEKIIDKIDDPDIVTGDRKNMAYSGSSITYGRGLGVVTATGMDTEVGKIAHYISSFGTEETPLQKNLSQMGKYLSAAVILVAAVIFMAGILQGRQFFEMMLTSISLAVAAIPEGLPAIVTIVLAMGVQKMAKKNAIIRKLPAVETLGSTEVICSDKTGTLTLNRMTVNHIFMDAKLMKDTDITEDHNSLGLLAQIMTLCNDSKVTSIDESNIDVIGDPTETALVIFAWNKGFVKEEMEKLMPRKGEIPFDSDRKLMTTINELNNRYRVMTKGAPDILIEKCTGIFTDGKAEAITDFHKELIREANSDMGGKALRVLALAYKDIDSLPTGDTPNIESDLVFAGLVGMIDPPREEAKEAVRICRQAGIKPVMITGDHKVTAAAIASQLEIIHSEAEVITGSELDAITAQDFSRDIEKYSVYARVSPEHKVRIVKAWQEKGKIVAMTGDGVNDAPALKTADIGVGMGITGTDVSKSVSDMVLSDDNFATIVTAVEEGRKIYSNIRKAIQFLISANTGEVITLFIATMLNWEILYPIHILWINLVTDALPALALGVEEAERDIMQRPPRKAKGSIFSGGFGVNVLYQGLLESAITLIIYYIGIIHYKDTSVAVTMAFAVLGLIQLTHSFNVRSSTKSIFQLGVFSNRYLTGAVVISVFLQAIVILVPGLNSIFRVSRLDVWQWLLVILMSLSIIPVVEMVKLIQRRYIKD